LTEPEATTRATYSADVSDETRDNPAAAASRSSCIQHATIAFRGEPSASAARAAARSTSTTSRSGASGKADASCPSRARFSVICVGRRSARAVGMPAPITSASTRTARIWSTAVVRELSPEGSRNVGSVAGTVEPVVRVASAEGTTGRVVHIRTGPADAAATSSTMTPTPAASTSSVRRRTAAR
jgi:hypothetical protein